MTKSEIFTLAHQICRFRDSEKAGNNIFRFLPFSATYKQKFSQALKYAYKQAKKESRTFDVEFSCYSKATYPATYKQLDYLTDFPNVTLETSMSSAMKRMERPEASALIGQAKVGMTIRIY